MRKKICGNIHTLTIHPLAAFYPPLCGIRNFAMLVTISAQKYIADDLYIYCFASVTAYSDLYTLLVRRVARLKLYLSTNKIRPLLNQP